jgi:hypothetical protein
MNFLDRRFGLNWRLSWKDGEVKLLMIPRRGIPNFDDKRFFGVLIDQWDKHLVFVTTLQRQSPTIEPQRISVELSSRR